MGSTAIKLGVALAMTCCVMGQEEEDSSFLGILNNNETLIDSISNESGTLTGDFSTHSLFAANERNAWQLEGPVVVTNEGQVLGRLSSFDLATDSLFNEAKEIQVPFHLRDDSTISGYRNTFSTQGPRVYDTQDEYKYQVDTLFSGERQWRTQWEDGE